MKNDYLVGHIVRLQHPCLGNPIHTKGYVFENYETGIQVIFENGEYCGFANYEIEFFFGVERDFDLYAADYIFTNVIQLTKDYRKGYWKWDTK